MIRLRPIDAPATISFSINGPGDILLFLVYIAASICRGDHPA
jgi:hypothetical protein